MMKVKVVRVYLSEGVPLLNEIYDFLHEHKILGATIFRGVKGFGRSGKIRESTLLDIHFDLPMILEFFDKQEKVDEVLAHFKDKIESGRMLHWFAELT